MWMRILNAIEAVLLVLIGVLLLIYPVQLIGNVIFIASIVLIISSILVVIHAIIAKKTSLRIVLFIEALVNAGVGFYLLSFAQTIGDAQSLQILLFWFVFICVIHVLLALGIKDGWHIMTIIINILLLLVALWAYIYFLKSFAVLVLILGGLVIILGIAKALSVFRKAPEISE